MIDDFKIISKALDPGYPMDKLAEEAKWANKKLKYLITLRQMALREKENKTYPKLKMNIVLSAFSKEWPYGFILRLGVIIVSIFLVGSFFLTMINLNKQTETLSYQLATQTEAKLISRLKTIYGEEAFKNNFNSVVYNLLLSKDKIIINQLLDDPNFLKRTLDNLNKMSEEKLLILANDPEIHPSILTKLFTYGGQTMLEAIACNPNTPENVLLEISSLNNNAIQLKLALNPNSSLKIINNLINNKIAIEEISKRNDINESIIERIVNLLYEDEVYSKYHKDNILNNLAMNQNISESTLLRLAEHENNLIRKIVAMHSKTPHSVLKAMIEDSSYEVREGIANNRNTSEELLITLSKDSYPNVRSSVAQNPSCPIIELISLSKDISVRVRESVAGNPKTPSKVLTELADEENEHIKFALANNRNVPTSVLHDFSASEWFELRCSIAMNPNVSVDTLKILSTDNDWEVRYHIAENPKTPPSLLRKMLTDKDERVRKVIKLRLK